MHPYGPPRKFFRPSGSRGGARLPSPGAAQDFTVDQDTPPSGFHQSRPYRLPPPHAGPLGGAPRYRFPPGPRPPFNPYPPAHYGYQHPWPPPGFGGPAPPPGRWGRGGYGHRGGRGSGWRGRGRGFRGRGGRYPYSKHGGDGSSDDIDAYYNKSMFEDPWKDFLPQGEQNEESAAAPPASSDSTTANQDGAATDDKHEQEMAPSTVIDTSAGKTDTGSRSENAPPSMESCQSISSGGCIDTENEADMKSQDSMLAGPGIQINNPSPSCVEDCQSTAAMGNAGDTGNCTKDVGDHLECVTNTDQESLQIEASTCTKVQD